MEEAASATFNSALDGGRSDRLSVACDRPHTPRHFFATLLSTSRYEVRTIQELLGHKDASKTMIYTQLVNKGGHSPVDGLSQGLDSLYNHCWDVRGER